MEIMVRIAIDKHIKNGNCKNSSDALVRLLEEDGIITLLKEFEPA
jgi:hypothetical protein